METMIKKQVNNSNKSSAQKSRLNFEKAKRTNRFNLTLFFNSAIAIFLMLWIFLTQGNQTIFKEALSASFIIVSILLLKTASSK